MSLKHGLLGLLNYAPMTGYELDKAFKVSLDFFWQAQTSQIYRELNSMEKSGLLTSKIEFQTSKPNKKLYTITDIGKKEFMDWLAGDNLDSKFRIRSKFLLKLFFSGEQNIPGSIALLEVFRTACIKELEELDKSDDNIEIYRETISECSDIQTLYWEFTAQFGKSYVKMCLDFADKAIKELRKLL